MAAEKSGRSLEETPTWAVAVVCFVLVAVSILLEHFIHLIGMLFNLIFLHPLQWLKKKHNKPLYESLEKIKSVCQVPTTPTHGMSSVHLPRGYRNEADSAQTSPRISNFDNQHWENEGSYHYGHHGLERGREDHELISMTQLPPASASAISTQHEINIESTTFLFNKINDMLMIWRRDGEDDALKLSEEEINAVS
ncbi:hypothetical protein HHK36_016583 [Tetracentron sinense]|uniref:Uncharacterized protein n=1 Tax=Tetracentron sinense TaxID=13715 RepID=A0A834Z0L0_TETSI|nr:hypothetical protein HHK36_016583 [Tetracentron sinense]